MASQPWDETEYRVLFATFPLEGRKPAGTALSDLAKRLDRSAAAVIAQWEDGVAYLGGKASVASEGLQMYLDRLRFGR